MRERPAVTQVRIASTRIPPDARPRLARLARRGYEVCHKHGAPLQTEICLALEIALLDLAGSELRVENAQKRASRAEVDLAIARRKIAELERDIAARVGDEFDTPTQTRTDPDLLERCRRKMAP